MRVTFTLHSDIPSSSIVKPGAGWAGQVWCRVPSQNPSFLDGPYYDVELMDGTGGVALTRAVCELTTCYPALRWSVVVGEI